MSTDDELDFTRTPAKPLPPPAPEKVASAKKEAVTGGPQLAKTGFYVAMARHASGGRVAPRNGERHVVFVVEDDSDLLKLVGEVLAKAGFLTRFARNRTEINAGFNETPLPDLVLLDVSLPDADGFQILERIRNHPKLAKLPVVMMTGKSEVTDVARGLTAGADGYVTKPFRISALMSSVNTVLGIE
ncbi:MAG TPA: response regulator [Usitatibacter sp.]|nr:response regulator [Usitatibacter sp.]